MENDFPHYFFISFRILFLFVLSNLCCSIKTWVGFLGCQVIYVTWRKLYNNLIIWKIWILTQIYQQCLNCIGTRTFEFWPNFKVNKGRSRELKHTNTVSIIGLLSFISCTLDGVYFRPEMIFTQNEISFCHQKKPVCISFHLRTKWDKILFRGWTQWNDPLKYVTCKQTRARYRDRS